jgi:hypothetical protein
MATTGNYQVDPQAVLRVLNDVGQLLSQIETAVAQVRGMAVPSGCYGAVGMSVASANTTLQMQSAATLAGLLTALAETSRRVRGSAAGYDRTDSEIALGWRRQASADFGR